MKNKVKHVVLCLLILVGVKSFSQVKQPDIVDFSNTKNVFHEISRTTQWSLQPQDSISEPDEKVDLVSEVPAIGKRHKSLIHTEVLYRKRLLVINLNGKDLRACPKALRDILKAKDKDDSVHFSAVITGNGTSKKKVIGECLSLFFHGFTAKNSQDLPSTCQAGMFTPRGVTASDENSLAYDELKDINTEVNAKSVPVTSADSCFVTSSEISCFWTLAKMKNQFGKQSIIITFHLLLNSGRTTGVLETTLDEEDFEGLKLKDMLETINERLTGAGIDKLSASNVSEWTSKTLGVIHTNSLKDVVLRVTNRVDNDVAIGDTNGDAGSSTLEPHLVAEGLNDKYNIVEYGGRYYGVRQSEGAFDIKRQSMLAFEGSSEDEVIQAIKASGE
ncbi:hypothetical protein P0136_11085 [Lentisphaerota bacterium ZTH]|nr:hypothetical protein JYG24_11395 [Lentisphaerota bacterium]WET05904.1 hypothetical protein P0136_11085 [Lentisphaerota bacterium ZTH]